MEKIISQKEYLESRKKDLSSKDSPFYTLALIGGYCGLMEYNYRMKKELIETFARQVNLFNERRKLQ